MSRNALTKREASLLSGAERLEVHFDDLLAFAGEDAADARLELVGVEPQERSGGAQQHDVGRTGRGLLLGDGIDIDQDRVFALPEFSQYGLRFGVVVDVYERRSVGDHPALVERDDGPGGERQRHRDERRQQEHALVGAGRNDRLLEDEFQQVGEGLEQAPGADDVRAATQLDGRPDLAVGEKDIGDEKQQRDEQKQRLSDHDRRRCRQS